jgi:protein FrlC
MYSSFPAWLPAYPIEYVIEKLASIGYDGIELGCASPVAYPPYLDAKERQKIKDLLAKHNIAISSVLPCPGGGMGNNVSSPFQRERDQAIKSYKECIELGSDLGAQICLYVAGWQIWGVSHEEAIAWSRECLVEISKYAEDHSMIMAIEPTSMDSNVIETADDALNLMKSVNRPNVKVMFDTIHILYRKEIITDYIDKMGKHIVHVHLSDVDRLPPGSVTNFKLMIEAFKRIEYNGYLTMEIGLGGRGIDPNAFALSAYNNIKSLI